MVAAHQLNDMGTAAVVDSQGEASADVQPAGGGETAASSTRTSESPTGSTSTERGPAFPRRHVQTTLKKWLE